MFFFSSNTLLSSVQMFQSSKAQFEMSHTQVAPVSWLSQQRLELMSGAENLPGSHVLWLLQPQRVARVLFLSRDIGC